MPTEMSNNEEVSSPEIDHGGTDEQYAVVQTPVASAPKPRFVPPTRSDVDILKLLTELEDLVESTRRGPMGILIGFPEDRFHTVLLKIRANLPEEMKRASALAREQEELLERVRDESTALLSETHQAAVKELERCRADAEHKSREIIEAGKAEAKGIIEAARKAGDDLVADSEIVQRAVIIADNTRAAAEDEAKSVRAGADEYARTVLDNLDGVLGKALNQIQRGRDLLDQNLSTK